MTDNKPYLRLLFLVLSYLISNESSYSQIDTIHINPVDQNMDTTILSKLHKEISSNQFGEVHGLLVVRNGHLVFEKYYNNFNRDKLHPLYSVTKTFTSALIGIAIDQGSIPSVKACLLDFFPDYYNPTYRDTLKQEIQLKHLLSMTGGFANEEGIWESDDYLAFMLKLPMDFTPGEVWNYSGGTSMLLSGIIQNTTGMSAEIFAANNLFKPLDISNWRWNTGPNNLTGAAGGLHLRPLDMAMFGQLYLQKGNWNGSQIISEKWIDESVQVHVGHASKDRSYGYHLWQYRDSSDVVKVFDINDIYFASGYGAQKIYVIPHLDYVIVITSDNAKFRPLLEKLVKSIQCNRASSMPYDFIKGK